MSLPGGRNGVQTVSSGAPGRRDVTSNVGLPTGANFPTKDEDGNLLETQYGESRFRDQQVGTTQGAFLMQLKLQVAACGACKTRLFSLLRPFI